jgi:hypothetical protein
MLNYVICINHHYEYENYEQTGYPGISGYHGSCPDGEGNGVHQGDSQTGIQAWQSEEPAAGNGTDQEGASTTAGIEAAILRLIIGIDYLN